MKNIKTFQGTKKRLKENAGAGLNKVVCVVIVLVLIVSLCVGGFYWYKCSKNVPSDKSVEMILQVGDYVSYAADINKIADWRVWKIEGDSVIIVPTEPFGDLTLEGAEDWLNAEEKIESECDRYVNRSLGITAENIRSMKIEDIEEVLREEEVESEKSNCDYGKEYSYESGIFYAEKADIDTFDGYNEALKTPKTASSSSPVKVKHTNWYDDIPIWNYLNNTKTGMTHDTYGTILGDENGWLASRCVLCGSNYAYFSVHNVNGSSVGRNYLYDSDGDLYSYSLGVRPLVTISSTLFNGAGGGTLSNPWQIGEKIESEEKTNGVMDRNISGSELVEMDLLQVGDYVSYVADIDANADWRVWKIEGDNIIIVPTEPLGDLTLYGAEDWLNAEEKIENECDKYINNDLGITAENIRSMKIEDVEEMLPEEEVESEKSNGNYGKEYSYESGTFYAEEAGTDTFDGYNKELSTPKTANSSSPVKLINTLLWYEKDVYSSLPLWKKLKNTKTGMTHDTYGTILGDNDGWLASCCVGFDVIFSSADFSVRYVRSGYVYYANLYVSDGTTISYSCGVRPLITLSSTLFNGAGGGTLSNPWQIVENL